MPYLHSAIGSRLIDSPLNSSGLSVRKGGRRMKIDSIIRKYTLEERKEIYSRPLEDQFVPIYKDGKAVVMKHLIKSIAAEDYDRVLDVAKVFAVDNQTTVYLLPEINAHEKALRASLGLSTDNGNTPDIMIRRGFFVDVKSPKTLDKLVHNAGKASRQFAIACITDHRVNLDVTLLDEYAKRLFGKDAYSKDDVYFYIDGRIYKKTKE